MKRRTKEKRYYGKYKSIRQWFNCELLFVAM